MPCTRIVSNCIVDYSRRNCQRATDRKNELPLLNHPLNEPTAFTPEALIEAVRAERGLAVEPPPPVCVLDFDGDLTDWLVAKGRARPWGNPGRVFTQPCTLWTLRAPPAESFRAPSAGLMPFWSQSSSPLPARN